MVLVFFSLITNSKFTYIYAYTTQFILLKVYCLLTPIWSSVGQYTLLKHGGLPTKTTSL